MASSRFAGYANLIVIEVKTSVHNTEIRQKFVVLFSWTNVIEMRSRVAWNMVSLTQRAWQGIKNIACVRPVFTPLIVVDTCIHFCWPLQAFMHLYMVLVIT